MPGVAGATGEVGGAGPQGLIGPTGPRGTTGAVELWTSYRDFWFEDGQASIHDLDRDKVTEIATYMKQNPSLQLGIDASTNPRATTRSDLNLRDRRIKAIRDSLIYAGVPANRISDGLFGDVKTRRDRRVEVFIKTRQFTQA